MLSVASSSYTIRQGSPPLWELAEGEETLLCIRRKGQFMAMLRQKRVFRSRAFQSSFNEWYKGVGRAEVLLSDGSATVNAATDVQWETDQEDYLYCTAADQVDRWHPEVSLTMNHALAKVSFRYWKLMQVLLLPVAGWLKSY